MSPSDAAAALGLSREMVGKLLSQGRLEVAARTVGGVRLLWTTEVKALVEHRRRAPRIGRGQAKLGDVRVAPPKAARRG